MRHPGQLLSFSNVSVAVVLPDVATAVMIVVCIAARVVGTTVVGARRRRWASLIWPHYMYWVGRGSGDVVYT